MDKTIDTPVIAVDGGGSRCRLALSQGQHTVRVETGAANVFTDFDGALRRLRQGIDALAARSGRSAGDLATYPAFIGLAGMTSPALEACLREALPFRHLRIADDRPAALRGALGRGDGCLAHCGTGSFFAAQHDGAMRFAGGWGMLLGDEASAQWVGRRTLALVLETADGRRPPSALAAELLAEFRDPPGILAFATRADPAAFGGLAPRVTDHALRGDPLAQAVVRQGAEEIARSLRGLGWTAGQTICLTGGIGPAFANDLPDDMQADLAAPKGTPLDGALALAWDFARTCTDATG